jgi:hypothetical protein
LDFGFSQFRLHALLSRLLSRSNSLAEASLVRKEVPLQGNNPLVPSDPYGKLKLWRGEYRAVNRSGSSSDERLKPGASGK